MRARSAMVSISDAVCSRPNAPSRSLPMPRAVRCRQPGRCGRRDRAPVERDARARRRAPRPLPAWHDHPGVERHADHRAAVDERADLIVGELPVVRHERAAIRVARPHRPAERGRAPPRSSSSQRCVASRITPSRSISRSSSRPRRRYRLGVRAVRVVAGPVVRRADRASPLDGPLEVPHRHDRVRALEAQDVADRRVSVGVAAPSARGDARARRRPDLRQLAPRLHLAVPGELPLRHRPRLLRRMPAGQRVVEADVAGDLCRHAQADPPAPHLGERDGALRRDRAGRSCRARGRGPPQSDARSRGSTRERSWRDRDGRRR